MHSYCCLACASSAGPLKERRRSASTHSKGPIQATITAVQTLRVDQINVQIASAKDELVGLSITMHRMECPESSQNFAVAPSGLIFGAVCTSGRSRCDGPRWCAKPRDANQTGRDKLQGTKAVSNFARNTRSQRGFPFHKSSAVLRYIAVRSRQTFPHNV